MLGSLVPKSWANDMPRSFFRDLSDLHRDQVTATLPPGFASRKVPIQIESHGSKQAA